MRRIAALVMSVACCLWPDALFAETPYRIGALTLGMSFEEAKAALPDANWFDLSLSPRSGKPLAIGARGAATNFGGLPVATAVEKGWYGASALVGIHQAPELDPAACEQRMTDFAAIVADRFGTLKGFMPTRPESRQGYVTTYSVGANGQVKPSGGHMMTFTVNVPLGTWVKLGERGKLARTTSESGSFLLDGRRTAGDVSIQFEGGWKPGQGCAGAITLRRAPKTPSAVITDRTGAPLDPAGTTIANRHHSLDFAPATFKVARSFFVRCRLSLPEGRAQACEAEKLRGTDDWFLARAGQIAQSSMPAMPDLTTGIDPDDPRPHLVRVKVNFDPAWRQSIDWTNARLTPLSEYPGLPQQPIVRPMPAVVAPYAKQDVRFTIRCRVETDVSIICASIAVDPPKMESWLRTQAFRTIRDGGVGPKLASGASAIGTVFETTVTFVLTRTEAAVPEAVDEPMPSGPRTKSK